MTDGVANVGLGALDELGDSEEAEAAASEFYERVGRFARQKGVTIDIIGVEGEGCDVEHLSVLAEETEGNLEKVNPLELTKNFGTILAAPIIATQAQAKFFLHRGLKVHGWGTRMGGELWASCVSVFMCLCVYVCVSKRYSSSDLEVEISPSVRFPVYAFTRVISYVTSCVTPSDQRSMLGS